MAKVLRRPARAFTFALASTMHAAGHAMLALAAAAVATALAEGWGASVPGSTPLEADGPAVDRALSLAFLGLAAVIVKCVGGVYASYVQARVSGEVGGALRLEVLAGLLAIHRLRRPRHGDHGGDAETATAAPVARGVASLTAHVREVEQGLHAGALGGARAALQLLPLLVILVWLAPKLAVIALAIFVPFSIGLARVRRRWKRANARAAREAEQLLEASDEAVRHADLWVTYGAEGKVRANVEALGNAMAERSARIQASAAALSGANEVLGALALVCAMVAARVGWLGEVASGATLLAFAIAFFLAYKPLRDLADARLALARASAAFEEMRGIRGHDGASAPAPAARQWPLGSLEVRGVRLARGDLAPVSFTVGAGEIVAIAGPTGIGKTTLLRTLLGLEEKLGGEILFDGAAIEVEPAGPSARPFAWVPQDAPLLADTLAANVALGADGADARASLAPIGAGHLVDRLDGARLGAGGRGVSGGERQWIALARAIATRLPVLLLDEPTSGLDADAQRVVLEGIARLRGVRSVVMVTHRSEPLAIADRVVRVG